MFRLLPLLLLPFTLLADTIPLEIPGLPQAAELSLPKNHSTSGKHPTLFYYHGKGGSPTTKLMRAQTGDQDWIIVGMTYTQANFNLSPESLAAERASYQKARQTLIAKHGTDPDQCYLAGFSLGGWFTDLMLQAEPSLKGGIIMGAGHAQKAPGALPKYATQKPVHIAIGRKDPNYIFALKGFLHHRALGGQVSLEVWPEHAHSFPLSGSESLAQWLKLRHQSPASLKATATKELSTALSKSDRLEPMLQWDRLIEIKSMPYFALTPPAWQAEFQKTLTALEATPEVKTEASLYSRHRRLLHQEITKQTYTTIKTVNAAYGDLATKFPQTRQGKLLDSDFKRTTEVLKNVKIIPGKKQPASIPTGPIQDRGIPRNPLIR